MEATISANNTSAARPEMMKQQMPLTFLRDGESARVLKVRGDAETRHHLENLGFISGAEVKVVTQQGGNCIVEVKGAQVAIDKSVASKVLAA